MSSEPLPISKLPTDFSELHKQEMARREKEEQENNKWVFEKPTAEENQKPAEPRRLSPDEIALWESLGDSNDEDEEEERIDKESLKRKCRNHINNRLQILKEGTEEILTTREFESLSFFDRRRIEFVQDLSWDPEDTDILVITFVQSRIDTCQDEEIVIGYETLLGMYDSILGPDFYYLSLFEGSPQLQQHERWCLYGI